MTLYLDEDTIELIEDFKRMQMDDSYAVHLASKILELYEKQS